MEAAASIAQLAAGGWPLGIPLAAGVAAAHRRAARRREALNAALHELRRPLQVLALRIAGEGDGGALRLALAALEDLDRQVNGTGPPGEPPAMDVAQVLEAALERWRPVAAREGREMSLRVEVPGRRLVREGIARAIDNLIANAIEHGTGAVSLGLSGGATLRVTVRDAGPRGGARRGPGGRRGHGLRIARDIARHEGGRVVMCSGEEGTVVAIELPPTGAIAPVGSR